MAPGDSSSEANRANRIAFFLFGVLSILLLLIGAWVLRTVAPTDASLAIVVVEQVAPSALPAPADPTPALKASLTDLQGDQGRLSAQLAALAADFDRKREQCKLAEALQPSPPPPPPPQQASKPPPRPQTPPQAEPSPPPPPPTPLPADRWAAKDLGVLQGCWNLGREAPTVVASSGGSGRQEDCVTKVGRICFDANGRGEREQTISCPRAGTMSCRAPVTGQFAADGTFRTTQPDVVCKGGSEARWMGRTLTCQRVDGANASCRDGGRPDMGFPAQDQEFRRAP